MIKDLLKILPAVASILKSLGSFFSFWKNEIRKKRVKKEKDKLSTTVKEVENAKTDDERRDIVKRL